MHSLKEIPVISTSSRRVTYKLLNPDLAILEMYANELIDDTYRRLFSQFCVTGHSLVIETGEAWERVPTCGGAAVPLWCRANLRFAWYSRVVLRHTCTLVTASPRGSS